MGGNKCVIKNCLNSYKNSPSGSVSFFRFPVNSERSKEWAIACGCLDFLEAVGPLELHKSYYRVCSIHFTDVMFLTDLNNRLQPHAVPTLHLSEGKPKTTDFSELTEIAPTGEKRKVDAAEDRSNEMTDVSTVKRIKTCVPSDLTEYHQAGSSKECVPLSPEAEPTTPPPTTPTKYTQTTSTLSQHSPRKNRLRQKVKQLPSKTSYLQKKIAKTVSEDVKPEVSLEDFKTLCDKFLPATTASFVKVQAQQFGKQPKGRRYTKEYKQMCLTIYFMGPKSYRYLSTLFCLPSRRTLTKTLRRR